MNTWAPLWSGIVDSSIWEESDATVKVFITLLALKDSDHICRLNAYKISRKCNKPEAEVIACLKILEAPDRKRLEKQPFDGRRIERVEDGWLVLNGEYYREMVSREMLKAKNRRAQEAYRRRQKEGANFNGSPMLPGEAAAVLAEGAGNPRGAEAIAHEVNVERTKPVPEDPLPQTSTQPDAVPE